MFDRYDLFEEMKADREMLEDAADFTNVAEEYMAKAEKIRRKNSKINAPKAIEKFSDAESIYYEAMRYREEVKKYYEKVLEESMSENNQ